MKPSLAIKTLFRTPGKTIFTFLLIAALTFSLFLQLAEYVKTAEEFHAAVNSYTGTGYVERQPAMLLRGELAFPRCIGTDPRLNASELADAVFFRYPVLSSETVAELETLPYISSTYKRYMTAGVSERLMRMQEALPRYDYNQRIIIEGTLDRITKETKHIYLSNISNYYLRDIKILAGDAKPEDITFLDGTMYFSDWAYRIAKNDAYPEALAVGERYVAVCRFERGKTNQGNGGLIGINETRESLQLWDPISEHIWPALCNITDAPENYLELPEYAPLRNMIEITQSDLYTLDVVYADDMTAIQRFHSNMLQIKEGRRLMPEDTANNAKVCVVDGVMAEKYHLKVGDKLPLKLGNAFFEQFYSLGAVACAPERFADEWAQEEFEIVGIYTGSTLTKDGGEPNWAYSVNTVFVPLSSLPKTIDLTEHEYAPGEFTFRVDNAWDIAPFLAETAPKIEAMGLTLTFDDGGWMEVLEGYRDAQRIPLIRIVLLSFVTVVGLALSVYLFVSRKKKDYAIMRALGTPKRQSGRALLIPIALLSLAAVLFAVCAGAIYVRLMIGSTATLPALICVGGELAATLAFAALSIRRLSRLSPLALLQGGGAPAVNKAPVSEKKPNAAVVSGSLYAPANIKLSVERPVPTRRPASVGFQLRYVWRHIRRQGFKSALALLLAVLMVGAVAQFASLRDTYKNLRETTPVKVQFINSMSQDRVKPLEETGLVKDLYYERSANISCMIGKETTATTIVIASDLKRFLKQDYEVTLGEGYTEADIGKLDHVLLGSEFMEWNGLRTGDIVRFGLESDFYRVFNTYMEYYLDELYYSKGIAPEATPTRDELYAYYQSEIDQQLSLVSASAVVIGSIRTESRVYGGSVFTSGLDNAVSLVGTFQTMPLVEFTLADNSRLEEMRQRGTELTGGRKGAFILDSEALESAIRTSDLLNGLYMPVIALALLIGAAMCALLVLQSGKEAAIMRALGTTKRTTRSMLVTEQILLSVIGALLGLAVMLFWKRAAFVPIALQAGLFAVGYVLALVLASYLSAALATRKNILELLQTKE